LILFFVLKLTQICAFSHFNDFLIVSDMEKGEIGCMKDLGITESFVVKRQVLLSATEAAEMILRVDNIIKAAPRKRAPDNRPC